MTGRDARRDVEVAIVDNYDSFANNLEQYVGEFARVEVARYRSVPEADGVVFSPGPGRPEEFPVMYDVLDRADVPVLGVCLGHQAVADYFGGAIGYADRVVHGKQSDVRHDSTGVFAGLPSPMAAGRYHSLVVSEVPDELGVTARGAGEVMGLAHPDRPVYGVQFHPESILTPAGTDLVRNFVDVVDRHRRGEWEPGVDPGTDLDGEATGTVGGGRG
ncbi:anthranilate/aminodeoxychorismate synthase component II [Halobacteriales archaeon QS_8_69_26]|nr:MAG: anthranilate/aminodeoxychorismate synthase component II [Halobacteriales archaeon QS_8_69_26]